MNRNLDTQGTRAVLRERLRVAVEAEGDNPDILFNVWTNPVTHPDLRDVRIRPSNYSELLAGNEEPSVRPRPKYHSKAELQQDVHPEDSASQSSIQGSKLVRSQYSFSSSVRVTRAMEASRKAGLLVKARLLKKTQEKDKEALRIQQEALRIQQEKEQMTVQSLIEESQAREEVLANFEREATGVSGLSMGRHIPNPSSLNVDAEIFHPDLDASRRTYSRGPSIIDGRKDTVSHVPQFSTPYVPPPSRPVSQPPTQPLISFDDGVYSNRP